MKALLDALLCCLGMVAQAQRQGAVYAAPGMQVKLQNGLPAEVSRVRKPFLTVPMTRFWLETDSSLQVKGMNQVLNAVRSRVRFPKAAMIDGIKGQIVVRAILTAGGVPTTLMVVGRSSTFEAVDKKVVDLLDAETIRVVQLLRFKPKAGRPDTLTLPMTYFFL